MITKQDQNYVRNISSSNRQTNYIMNEEVYVRRDQLGLPESKQSELTAFELEQKKRTLNELKELQMYMPDDYEWNSDEYKAFEQEERLLQSSDEVPSRYGSRYAIQEDVNTALLSATNYDEYVATMSELGHTVNESDGVTYIDDIPAEKLSWKKDKDGNIKDMYGRAAIERDIQKIEINSNNELFMQRQRRYLKSDYEDYGYRYNADYSRRLDRIAGQIIFSRRPLMEKLFLFAVVSMFRIFIEIARKLQERRDALNELEQKQLAKNEAKALKCKNALDIAQQHKVFSKEQAEERILDYTKDINELKNLKSEYSKKLFLIKKQLEKVDTDYIKKGFSSADAYENYLRKAYSDISAEVRLLDADIKLLSGYIRTLRSDFIPFIDREFAKHLQDKTLTDIDDYDRNDYIYEHELYASNHLKRITAKRLEIHEAKEDMKNGRVKFATAKELNEAIAREEYELSQYIKIDKCDRSLVKTHNINNPMNFTEEMIENLSRNGKPLPTMDGYTAGPHGGNMRYANMIILGFEEDVTPEEAVEMAEEFVKRVGLDKFQCVVAPHCNHYIDDTHNAHLKDILTPDELAKVNRNVDVHVYFSNYSYAEHGERCRAFQAGENGIKLEDQLKISYEISLEHGKFRQAIHTDHFRNKILPTLADKKGTISPDIENEKLAFLSCIVKDTLIERNGNEFTFTSLLFNNKTITINASNFKEAIDKFVDKVKASTIDQKAKDITVRNTQNFLKAELNVAKQKEIDFERLHKTADQTLERECDDKIPFIKGRDELANFFKNNQTTNPALMKDKVRADIHNILVTKQPKNFEELKKELKKYGYDYVRKQAGRTGKNKNQEGRHTTIYISVGQPKDGFKAFTFDELDNINGRSLNEFNYPALLQAFNRKDVSTEHIADKAERLIKESQTIIKLENGNVVSNEYGVKTEHIKECENLLKALNSTEIKSNALTTANDILGHFKSKGFTNITHMQSLVDNLFKAIKEVDIAELKELVKILEPLVKPQSLPKLSAIKTNLDKGIDLSNETISRYESYIKDLCKTFDITTELNLDSAILKLEQIQHFVDPSTIKIFGEKQNEFSFEDILELRKEILTQEDIENISKVEKLIDQMQTSGSIDTQNIITISQMMPDITQRNKDIAREYEQTQPMYSESVELVEKLKAKYELSTDSQEQAKIQNAITKIRTGEPLTEEERKEISSLIGEPKHNGNISIDRQ